jgi:hypothetical protein
MIIAVTDACIFIDILELEISSNFFLLAIEIHTTQEVWNELDTDQKQTLKSFLSAGKLTIHILEPEDLERISLINYPKALSPPDKSVLYIAEKLEATLLSSDGVIRKYAKKEKITTHGLFWVFDELVIQQLLSKEEACRLLNQLFETNLMYKNNNKLWKEAEKRLDQWKEL